MSSERLLEAAALMRSRAEAARPGPWALDDEEWADYRGVYAQEADGQAVLVASRMSDDDAEHIASWHPAAARAVAAWLEAEVRRIDLAYDTYDWTGHPGLAVADAFLGGAS